ncbi:RDD family protein [Streptomyces sp. NPDC007910]|uniref:RDD family protein n=1 Tax=Streptomyces sp. NPDC007910 TaxID=3364790 RepID=UPI0036E43E90
MATPPGGGGEVPQAGYYPDPSIPGYIRYWNGGAWVPGTSRPAPSDGDAPPPPAAAAPAGPLLAPGPAPAPTPVPAPAAETERPAASVPAQAQAPDHVRARPPAQDQPQDQPRSQAPAHVPALTQAPAPAPAHVPAQDRTESPAPAPVRTSAPAPVPTVEETGPVFLDEEPAPAEPASAWQADTSRQTGFGGDRDQKVSWGAPRSPDPRTPAEWPVAGEQAEPQAPAQAQAQPQAPAPVRPADPRPAGGAARLGGMPVTPIPAPAPRPAPQPAPEPAPAPVTPAWAQPQAQPQPQAQAQPQAQPQPPSQEQQPPVVPWKPPVEDPFLQAARAQASARPAGLGRRLLARLIDSAVTGALAGAAAFPFLTAALDHIEGKIEAARQSGTTVQVWLVDSTTSVQFGIALAALVVVGILYEVLPTAKWGRTLGKKLCGIQVRDIEAHEPPTFGGSLKRWLVYGVLGLLAVGFLNVLWCVFDRPWRQCWHDKAARTFVAR